MHYRAFGGEKKTIHCLSTEIKGRGISILAGDYRRQGEAGGCRGKGLVGGEGRAVNGAG